MVLLGIDIERLLRFLHPWGSDLSDNISRRNHTWIYDDDSWICTCNVFKVVNTRGLWSLFNMVVRGRIGSRRGMFL